jgi:hypothetical protein
VQDYPCSSTAQPVLDIDGPLSAQDPARSALSQHLSCVAAEQQEELAGSGGYIWQLVGAAKEWIDANLNPADLASRKAGQFASMAAGAAAAATAPSTYGSAAATGAAGAAGAADAAPSDGNGVPWWDKEAAIDLQLVDRATSEAAAAHWASWSVSQEDNPWGPDDKAASAAAPAAAAAGASTSSSSSAEALASAGDGSRGRWDYVIGLVGKPSAGKSTFFNAVTGEGNCYCWCLMVNDRIISLQPGDEIFAAAVESQQHDSLSDSVICVIKQVGRACSRLTFTGFYWCVSWRAGVNWSMLVLYSAHSCVFPMLPYS